MRTLEKFVLFLLIPLCPSLTEASHYRGGTIGSKPDPFNNGMISFRFRLAFRRSFSSSYFCDQYMKDTGAIIGSGDYWSAQCNTTQYGVISGCSNQIVGDTGFHCTDYSLVEDWSTGENNFTYTFPNVYNVWTVSYTSCCWIHLSYGGASSWLLSTTVDLTQRADTNKINSSPLSTSPAILRLQEGCFQSIRIPVEDPDGDIVKCRWSHYFESYVQKDSFPYSVLNERNCVLFYNGTSGSVGTYAVALTLEDFPAGTTDFVNTRPFSSVGLQFLVIISGSSGSCSSRPGFTGPTPRDGQCSEVQIGSSYTAAIEVNHPDPSERINEIMTTSPAGMHVTPMNYSGGSFYANVTWYPTQYQIGQQVFCFKAVDSLMRESDLRCVTILVGMSNTPRVILGSGMPRNPISISGDGTIQWSVQFDRVIKKPRSSAFIRLVLRSNGFTVYKMDTLSSLVTIGNNQTVLYFSMPTAVLSMTGSYAIMIDQGAVVGLGCSYDGPPTPGTAQISDWSFNITGICSTGYHLAPPLFYFCTDANECGSHSRTRRSAAFGQCFHNLNGLLGDLASPNYPSNYNNGHDCAWLITVTAGYYVQLTMLHFTLEYGGSHCPYDYVEVFDGSSTSAPLITKRCGTLPSWCVHSSNNFLLVRFKSDSSVVSSGFFARYEQVSCGSENCLPSIFSISPTRSFTPSLTTSSSLCVHYLNDKCGNIWSQNYPNNYDNNHDCTWLVSVTHGRFIQLDFVHFMLEGGSSCPYDYVEIFDGNSISAPSIVKRCSNQPPWCVHSSGHSLLIRMHTDHSVTGSGFFAHYKEVSYRLGNCLSVTPSISHTPSTSYVFVSASSSDISPMPSSSSVHVTASSSVSGPCHYNLTAWSGNFSSPNHPSNYNNNHYCTWLINVYNYYYVELTFSSFYLEHGGNHCPYDYVEIFDGNSTSAPRIIKRCGSHPQWCVHSSGSSLLVRFRTDGSVTSSGFSAYYETVWYKSGNCHSATSSSTLISLSSAVSSFTSSAAISPMPSSSSVHVTASSSVSSPCHYNLTAWSGNFSSPNHPSNYNNNHYCTWLINVYNYYYVELTFSSFYLEHGGNHCPYDYVEIFDGNSTSAPRIIKRCGSHPQWCVHSSGSSLLVRFRTDGSVTSSGFSAYYETVWYKSGNCHSATSSLNLMSLSSAVSSFTSSSALSLMRLSSAVSSFTSSSAISPTSSSSSVYVTASSFGSSEAVSTVRLAATTRISRFPYSVSALSVNAIQPTSPSSAYNPASSVNVMPVFFDFHLPMECDQMCDNVPGSYTCSCVSGYRLNPDGRTCSDVNECLINNGGCSHQCVNIPGSFYCACPNGTTMGIDNSTCVEPGVSVTCGSDNITVTLEKSIFPFLQTSDLRLRYSSCRAKQNATHILLSTPLNSCGTNYNESQNDFVFWNVIRGDIVVVPYTAITRSHDISIPFYCRYSRKTLVSLSFTPQRLIVFPAIPGYGNFTFRMDFYKTSSFVAPYAAQEYPLIVGLNDYVYLEYSVVSAANLVVMAENCRATKDGSFYSWPQYTLIREGCLQDQTTLYNYDPSRAYQRFQIKTFRFFNDYGNVYLHCELIACHRYTSNSRCHHGCLSSASARRKRREVPSNQRGNEQIESTPKAILSGGPVIIKDVRKPKDPKQINHENFIAVVAAVSGFALIAVIALSVLFVKYRIARLLMNRNKVGDMCATQDIGARTTNEYVQDQDVIELEDEM